MNARALADAFRPAGHPPVEERPDRRAHRQSRHAGGAPTTGRCGGISGSSSPTAASSRRRARSGRPILNFILLKRPAAKGRDYASIWNNERNEGPLKTITRSQAEKLQELLAGLSPRIEVDWAMRYGQPAIADRIAALQAKGCDRLLVVPLYPQYCAATSATVCRQGLRCAEGHALAADATVAAPWHDDPVYIEALARSIRDGLARLDFEPELVLASFHGIPQDYFDKGDPYYCHCAKTTRLVREALGWPEDRLRMTFQSRFGRAEWLKPYTDETVKELAASGVKRLAVVTPGFAADCLETLEEIARRERRIFPRGRRRTLRAYPLPQRFRRTGIAVIEAVARRELAGWV